MKQHPRALACILVLTVSLMCCGVAAGQDYLYIRNSTISETPKIIESPVGSLGEIDFMNNPAQLRLDSSFRFLSNAYYLGSFSDISTSDIQYGNGQFYPIGTVIGFSEMDGTYVTNNWGMDVGFALEVASGMNLAFVFDYLYEDMRGDSDSFTFTDMPTVGGEYFWAWSDREDTFRSNTYASTLVFSYEATDSLSLGAGFTYAFVDDDQEISESGTFLYILGGVPSTGINDIVETVSLKYHNISPFIGVTYAPSGMFSIAGSLALNNYFGSVSKEAEAAVPYAGATNYAEDVDHGNLDGWGIEGDLMMSVGLSDTLSIPIVFSMSYDTRDWSADGAAYGWMDSCGVWYFVRTEGIVGYDSDIEAWDMSAGAGVTYASDGFACTFMPIYTHREFTSDFSSFNRATGAIFPPAGDYLFTQSDKEVVDVLSFDIQVEKTFSDMLSGEFGLRYDYGWAKRDYDMHMISPWEFAAGNYLDATNSGKDQFHDLTLTTKMSVTPVENLAISLSGMVTIPLDSLDYDLSGSAVGMDPAAANFLYRTIGIDRDYRDSTWVYGGMLELTYEF